MALDVGAKRIGVAVSDPLGITAQGLDTIQRRNKRRDLEALGHVLAKYDVREIVVGLPLRLSGAEGIQSGKMRPAGPAGTERIGSCGGFCLAALGSSNGWDSPSRSDLPIGVSSLA